MSNYRKIKAVLTSAGIDEGEARAIALLLLEQLCGMGTAEALIGKEVGDEVEEAAQRVAKGEPVQYVTGQADFCGLTLHVEPGVLIPRPETEELAVWAISEWKAMGDGGEKASVTNRGHILDIGTGSGCIALALAKECRGAKVEAWDVSGEALHIAQGNAERNGVEVEFRQVDVLKADGHEGEEAYDMIVSNPPYICNEEAADMQPNVLDHEPHLALFVPDDDPLLFYRRIASMAQRMLRPGGRLLFETNRRFAQQTADMLRGMGYDDVEVRRDQFGNDRMVRAIKEGKNRL